jgi:hypothetical protein
MVMLGAAPDRGREVVVGSLQVESVRRLRLEPVVASVPAPNPQ